MEVARPNLNPIRACACKPTPTHNVVNFLTSVEPVLLVCGPGEEACSEQGRSATVPLAKQDVKITDRPTLLGIHGFRRHIVEMHQYSLANTLSRLLEVFFRHIARINVTSIIETARSDIKPENFSGFVLGRIKVKMVDSRRNEPAESRA